MSSKLGYKIVLQAGEELLRVLDNSRPERREVLDLGQTLLGESNKVGMTGDQQEAFAMLERHGILPAKAGQLVQRFGSDSVMDTVEYLEGQMTSGKRRNIENPAGLIIYSLENGLPVPAGFMSARRRKELQESARLEETKRQARLEAEMAYERWIEREQQAAVSAKYPERALQLLVEKIVAERTHSDESFRRVPQSSRPAVAMQIIRKEVRQELVLPSFEEWWASSSQIDLFS